MNKPKKLCDARNGAYACTRSPLHLGAHTKVVNEAGKTKVARWTTAYGKVRMY